MSSYDSKLLAWAIGVVVEGDKAHGQVQPVVVLEKARELAAACYDPEKDFESLLAELADVLKTTDNPLGKATQMQLEIAHMIEDIERQGMVGATLNDNTQAAGAA